MRNQKKNGLGSNLWVKVASKNSRKKKKLALMSRKKSLGQHCAGNIERTMYSQDLRYVFVICLVSILCISKLIYKPQVEGRQRENNYPNLFLKCTLSVPYLSLSDMLQRVLAA